MGRSALALEHASILLAKSASALAAGTARSRVAAITAVAAESTARRPSRSRTAAVSRATRLRPRRRKSTPPRKLMRLGTRPLRETPGDRKAWASASALRQRRRRLPPRRNLQSSSCSGRWPRSAVGPLFRPTSRKVFSLGGRRILPDTLSLRRAILSDDSACGVSDACATGARLARRPSASFGSELAPSGC